MALSQRETTDSKEFDIQTETRSEEWAFRATDILIRFFLTKYLFQVYNKLFSIEWFTLLSNSDTKNVFRPYSNVWFDWEREA